MTMETRLFKKLLTAEEELADLRRRLLAAELREQALRVALTKISAIRDDIIARQTVNWSAHIYPLVAALKDAALADQPPDSVRAEVERLLIPHGPPWSFDPAKALALVRGKT